MSLYLSCYISCPSFNCQDPLTDEKKGWATLMYMELWWMEAHQDQKFSTFFICECVCTVWLSDTLNTPPARCRNCVRQDPCWVNTQRSVGWDKARRLSEGDCFHFWMHPHTATPPTLTYCSWKTREHHPALQLTNKNSIYDPLFGSQRKYCITSPTQSSSDHRPTCEIAHHPSTVVMWAGRVVALPE